MVREITGFESGIEQHVVRLYAPDQLVPQVVSAGISHSTLDLDSSHSGWNWPVGAARLRKVIRAFEPDVIHSSLFSANLVAQLAARVEQIPVLSTFTLSGDVELVRSYQPGAGSRRASALRSIAGWAARSDHVWFRAITSDALTTNCQALGVSESRGVLIPRGVPMLNLKQEALSREELGLPGGLPIVLNVGRQTTQKGHKHLIAAFEVLQHSRSAHLVIIGREGDGSSALRTAIDESNLEDHVTVIPYTDRVNDFLLAADVFAFPSLMEGLGTAILEAMAARLPVVASDIPPIREITDQGRVARLVPVGDTEALATALERALGADQTIRHMTDEAHHWVSENYSLHRVSVRLQDRLQQLCSIRLRAGSR